MSFLSSHRTGRGSRRRSAAAAGASLAALLVLTACATSTEPAETEAELQAGGTLQIGITGDPGNLDPTMAATLTSISVYNSMCELLYNVKSDGVVYPELAAAEPEFNDDNTVATVKLRKDATFQDGTPFNADAVKFSLDRHMTTQGSQRTNELDAVKEVVVVDEYTVEVHLHESISPGAFSVIFTDRAGIMVSPTAVQELGDEGFSAAPVCVGAFKFDSRVAQDSITLVKDENYYAADEVHLDSIVYRVISDTSVRVTNLRSGDIDAMERVSTTDLAALEGDSNVEVFNFPGLGYYNLEFNVSNAGGSYGEVDTSWAKDKRVRQALAMAIDREAINTVAFNGAFAPACSFMAPSSAMATDANQSCPKYDPKGAKALLEKAGVQMPVRIELMLNQAPELRRMAEVIQSMAAEAGFDIQLDIGESTATVERGYGGDFDLYVNSWSGRIDPDANISQFAMSDSPRSMSRFNNSRVDELLVMARSSASVEERTAAYDEIHEILQDEAPLIFLIRPANLVAAQADVAGLEFRPNGTIIGSRAGFLATS